MTDVIVIGDIHGNARALRAALDRADRGRVDHLVFVGDLLTYGHDVEQVLDIVQERQQSGATLLLGNHDKMYLDICAGERAYLDRLPDWIKHSVDKTLESLDANRFHALPWRDEVVHDGVVISHANPFGGGDWTYLNALEEHQRAAEAVAARELRAGVFGHTHRGRWYVGDSRSATVDVELSTMMTVPKDRTLIANAGAVGQPRDQRKCAVILRLSIDRDRIEGLFEPVGYDVTAHIAQLRSAGLPTATTEKLCAFFAAA
jgi:predicted phosphodiesterase